MVVFPKRLAINMKPIITTKVTLDASPSMPSVRLTAFTMPMMRRNERT
jgi:hypothetical protein